MINWLAVIANSFWILGGAVILAEFSFYYWQAQQEAIPFTQIIGTRGFQQILMIGLLLVGIGLATTSQNTWQAIPAILLIAGCLAGLFVLRRSRSHHR